MPCQILVSNKSGLPKAEIISVVDGSHVWTKNESMQAFLDSGGLFEDWSRQFSIVIVTDKTKDELSYLQDYNSLGDRKWFFIEPNKDSSEWDDLYFTGQTERNWLTVESFTGER